MEELQKLLRKLSQKERTLLRQVMDKILAGQWEGLNIQRLRGYHHIFRVRVGNYRILYYYDDTEILIKSIRRRNERTYTDC